mmetsp:Transcript_17865/g.53786  ORF Transcript_17865/g.53786 Transcript_17865/m.53786 type:complete len:503 (+) Transcript_17865:242-1750(+)
MVSMLSYASAAATHRPACMQVRGLTTQQPVATFRMQRSRYATLQCTDVAGADRSIVRTLGSARGSYQSAHSHITPRSRATPSIIDRAGRVSVKLPPSQRRSCVAGSGTDDAGQLLQSDFDEAARFTEAREQPEETDNRLPEKYHRHWWDLAKQSSVRGVVDQEDPSLNMTLVSSGTSISQLFTQDMWERHRSVRRYFHNLATISSSTVFRRIFRPWIILSLVSTALTLFNVYAPPELPRLALANTAHTLLGAAISLLLVFRTNASYGRFQEARKLWGSVVRYCRDGMRICTGYCSKASLDPMVTYFQAFPWVLKGHLRKGRSRPDPNDPTKYKDDPRPKLRALKLPAEEIERYATSLNGPYEVLLKLTRLTAELPVGLPGAIRLQLDHALSELVLAAGGCERLIYTPVPLSYTRHTSRCMMLWLVTLPAALWPTMGWATAPAAAVVTFILLGIDELGVQIEESFGFLPLGVFCRAVQSDAAAAIKSQQTHGQPDSRYLGLKR